MEIIGFIIEVISGAVGGYLAGVAWREKSMGTVPNALIGIVGGVIGCYLMHSLGILDFLSSSTMNVATILGTAGVGAFFGALLTGVVGIIKKADLK